MTKKENSTQEMCSGGYVETCISNSLKGTYTKYGYIPEYCEVDMFTVTVPEKEIYVYPPLRETQLVNLGTIGIDPKNEKRLKQSDNKNEQATSHQTHIIPAVGKGRLPGSRHIRLFVVEQEKGQTYKKAYETNMKVFDPRDFGLSAQNTFDDTNCGRYVTAMTIQAAGLARDGLPITKENLKASPAVQRALHFNTAKDAAKGLLNAYVKPLPKKPTPQELFDHNEQKLACLKAEYEARKSQKRDFHGTSIFGGYGTATFFTRALGYSASDKLTALKVFELEFKNVTQSEASNFFNEFKKANPAAGQGMLKECLKGMIKAVENGAKNDIGNNDDKNTSTSTLTS